MVAYLAAAQVRRSFWGKSGFKLSCHTAISCISAVRALEARVSRQMVFHFGEGHSRRHGSGRREILPTEPVHPDLVQCLCHQILGVTDKTRQPRHLPRARPDTDEQIRMDTVDQHQAGHAGGVEAGEPASVQGSGGFRHHDVGWWKACCLQESVQVASLGGAIPRIGTEVAPAGTGPVIPARGGEFRQLALNGDPTVARPRRALSNIARGWL